MSSSLSDNDALGRFLDCAKMQFRNSCLAESVLREAQMQKSRIALIGVLLSVVSQSAVAGNLCQNHGCKIDSLGGCFCWTNSPPPQVNTNNERLAWILANHDLVNS